jgi:hypothetical protein
MDWDAIYNGPSTQGGHQGYNILLDGNGNVYVIGSCEYQANIERIATIKYARTEPFNCFVGVETVESEVLEIYPNPVNDQLNINNVAQDDIFSLYGLLGEVVLISKINPGSNRIVLPELPRGIYLYRLASGLKSGKLIFQ